MDQENNLIEAIPFERAEGGQSQKLIRIRPLQLVVGVIFLILAIAAAFLFSASAVRVTIDPKPDTFRFTSGFSYQLGERYLMLPGTYSFTTGKSGYHILSSSIEVTDDPDQDFRFELEKLPGILEIGTIPEVSAIVLVDQKDVGSTPLRLDEISPGLHDISIHSDRYLDFDTEITIEGMREIQSLEVSLSPAWADITVTSTPDEAEILVDGISLGSTPQSVEALEGKRDLQISKKGYKTWQTSIEVLAGVDQILEPAILIKSDGKVSILSSPAGANVNINGRYRGQTPIELSLAPGQLYNIQLSKAGYEPLEREISIEPEQDLSLSNVLSPILGNVSLMVEPAGSELFVDGKSMGEASTRLSLTANPHEIRITKNGYADYTARVTPQPGSSQQIFIRLQTEEEARIAAIPTTIENGAGQMMNLIIPAEFTMGAGRREPGRRSNEIQKQVQLTTAYYLSESEVTNEQFKLFDAGHDSGILGRALLSDDDRPVVNLSWSQAAAFCNWLSEMDGLPLAYRKENDNWVAVTPLNSGYRLPTEAEWAWAARYAKGPDPTRFPWGDTMPPVNVVANYADESAISMVPYHISGYDDSFRGPAPIMSYPANEFGIFDLAGNVSEWIHDHYSVEIPKEKLINPTGPKAGDYYVIRGSSYKHGRFSELRWTYRGYGSDPQADVGFRVARLLEEGTE